MADVFTVLSQDHQEVKRMLAELEKGPSRVTGASEDQLALRKKMTEQLIIEESKHEALEEMYFWPVVRDHLPDGDTLADQATGQEQEAKEVLAKLDKLDAGDAEFEKLLGTFIGAAREHIAVRGDRGVAGTAHRPEHRAGGRAGHPDRRGQEDRAHPPASAHAALARRAQGGRADRGRGGQGARRGDRARRLIRPGRAAPGALVPAGGGHHGPFGKRLNHAERAVVYGPSVRLPPEVTRPGGENR